MRKEREGDGMGGSVHIDGELVHEKGGKGWSIHGDVGKGDGT